MTGFTLFAPGKDDLISASDLYERLSRARTEVAFPFAAERLELIAGVSDRILRTGKGNVSSYVTHFAFWTRAAALKKLEQSFNARLPASTQARARGLVFHLPPQNVETVFLYSWVLSYLAGNANVVRLPREISTEMRAICDQFLTALEAAGDHSQLFGFYPSSSDIGMQISALSDARIVWGGDQKVKLFSGIPLRNGGKSIWFGDRFSFSVMNGDAIAALDRQELAALAQRLANDILVFDQMACSSPQIIYVVGDRQKHAATLTALVAELGKVAHAKGQIPATGHIVRKMVEAFSAAASGEAATLEWRDNAVTTLAAEAPGRREQRVGGGFVWLEYINTLHDVSQFIREYDQTVTYFGFSTGEIGDLVGSRAGFGVSRWAPVGAALDFDYIWDGYDIPVEVTRLISVR